MTNDKSNNSHDQITTRIACGVYTFLAVMFAFSALVHLACGGLPPYEAFSIVDAPYRPQTFHPRKLLGILFTYGVMLMLPATIVTVWFIRARERVVRLLLIIVALLYPYFVAGLATSRPHLVENSLKMPRTFVRLVLAVITGAKHSGEWWSERNYTLMLGLLFVSILGWTVIALVEIWNGVAAEFRRTSEVSSE